MTTVQHPAAVAATATRRGVRPAVRPGPFVTCVTPLGRVP